MIGKAGDLLGLAGGAALHGVPRSVMPAGRVGRVLEEHWSNIVFGAGVAFYAAVPRGTVRQHVAMGMIAAKVGAAADSLARYVWLSRAENAPITAEGILRAVWDT